MITPVAGARRTAFQTGFSLIELAIVLFILSLILGGLLVPLTVQIEQKERELTQAQLEEIRDVLYGFIMVSNGGRNRFPCPDCRTAGEGTCLAADVGDGQEDRNAGANNICKSEIGNLPWATLGIKGTDAWDQPFTYRVRSEFADDIDGTGDCTPNTVNVSFALCSIGDIDILDSNGGTAVAQDVPAIVISHGKNYSVAPTAHEEENYDDSTVGGDTLETFVDKDFSDDAVAGFDDLVIWISPHILRTKMLNAGILP